MGLLLVPSHSKLMVVNSSWGGGMNIQQSVAWFSHCVGIQLDLALVPNVMWGACNVIPDPYMVWLLLASLQRRPIGGNLSFNSCRGCGHSTNLLWFSSCAFTQFEAGVHTVRITTACIGGKGEVGCG